MSLIRQLWLAVLVSAIVAFSGSLLVSILSTQDYLTLQLERKNSDVASSLALSMSQLAKDNVTTELQVAALFDTGYYYSITIFDTHGKIISQRVQDKPELDVPSWFSRMFRIDSTPGSAPITDGWNPYGSVQVISHTQLAYRALWEQACRLLYWFALGGVGVGLLGMLGLRNIARSIHSVVEQANAIGERRFVTVVEPRATELKLLTRAMNGMVERVRLMFHETAGHLDELRRAKNYDTLTNVPNRDYFMQSFGALLSGDEAVHCGVLLVCRVTDLALLNEKLGRNATDDLLTKLGGFFDEQAQQFERGLCGRVKAAEFALVLPGESLVSQVAERICSELQQAFDDLSVDDFYQLGATRFEHNASMSDVFAMVDTALALAAVQGANRFHVIENHVPVNRIPSEQWRTLLSQALRDGYMALEYYPVVSSQGVLLHQEGMVRLLPSGSQPLMMAGDFMPIAAQLNLTALIDLEVIRMAIHYLLQHHDGDVAVNLSAKTLDNWAFRDKLFALLRENASVCPRLWFEVAEYGAFKYFDAFKDICATLKAAGCKVGVEQFGQYLSESQRLTELGLDYVKTHFSLAHGIEDNLERQGFLRRFCEIAHALGIVVIAVGVRTEVERNVLLSLGVDGLTGTVVTLEAIGVPS